jgi:chromosome partitioning protein
MRLNRTHVIVMANQKGGCGKTTTSINLGAGIARKGFQVCVVDNDDQCNASEGLGVSTDSHPEKGLFTTVDAYMKKRPLPDIAVPFEPGEGLDRAGLSLSPAHRGLSAVEDGLNARLQQQAAEGGLGILELDELRSQTRSHLRQSLEHGRGRYDVIIIDPPPSLGFLMVSALVAADWYMIPVFPSTYDVRGLERLSRTTRQVRSIYKRDLSLLGVVLGNTNRAARFDQDIYERLESAFPDKVFQARVASSVRHKEAAAHGTTIFEHSPGHQGGEQFAALADEVITRLQKAEAAPSEAVAHG